jgi:hypothetical protein
MSPAGNTQAHPSGKIRTVDLAGPARLYIFFSAGDILRKLLRRDCELHAAFHPLKQVQLWYSVVEDQ